MMAADSKTVIQTRCPAKVNLTFEILGTLPDGYHEVRTLMQSISLEDELTFEFSDGEGEVVFLSVDSEYDVSFPKDDSNLIARAIAKYQEALPEARKVDTGVRITKYIPIGAGLAGGSANAAAALTAINHRFGDALSAKELQEIGARLGADVPFCLTGGSCIGTHKGDELEPVERTFDFTLVLVKPNKIGIPTPWAYSEFDRLKRLNSSKNADSSQTESSSSSSKSLALDENNYPTRSTGSGTKYNTTQKCVEALSSSIDDLSRYFKNDFEEVIYAEHPELANIKDLLVKFGAAAACLTGSGPTLFGILEKRADADQLVARLMAYQLRKSADTANQATRIYPLDIFLAEAKSHGARVV